MPRDHKTTRVLLQQPTFLHKRLHHCQLLSLFTMKIYGSALLALVSLHSCSAFVSQPAAASISDVGSSSRLYSERAPQRVNAGEGYPRSSADVINTDLSRRASAEDYGIGGTLLADPPMSASLSQLDDSWQNSVPVKVQGGSLRTWSFESPRIEYVQVLMKTEGRPLNAEVELWQGPGAWSSKCVVIITCSYCCILTFQPSSLY